MKPAGEYFTPDRLTVLLLRAVYLVIGVRQLSPRLRSLLVGRVLLRPVSSHRVSTLIARLVGLVEAWPSDPTRGDRDIRCHLQTRARELTRAFHAEDEQARAHIEVEAEVESITRLLNNHHRNTQPLPRGLGASLQTQGAPVIAATGLSLEECRNALTQIQYKRTLATRIWNRII